MYRFRKMAVILLVLALICGIVPMYEVSAQNDVYVSKTEDGKNENTVNFDDDWLFCLEPAGEPHEADYDDTAWSVVTLPYDWSIYRDFESQISSTVGSLRGGNGWYRKHFTLPESYAGKRINIDFDGVYQDSYIYVNGQLVGNYPNGYVPFSFDITDYVVCDGKTQNVIAVSVTNATNENGSGYTSRWYSGSGIYRDVYLTVTNPVHIEKYGVVIRTPDLEKEYSSGKVTVEVVTTVENETDKAAGICVRNTVMNYYGVNAYSGSKPVLSSQETVEPSGTFSLMQKMTVENPKLWTPDEPKLYVMKTEILKDGEVIDTYENTFGFKYFTFDAEKGFFLNGKYMKIQGVCLHHDQGALGACGNEAAFRRQLTIMKEMGANAVRTSHNAASPKFIKLCNEMGIMVFEESFDTWWDGKNDSDYGKQFFMTSCTHPDAQEGITWGKYDLQQIVKKDRNSPCIIIWGIGNECAETTYNDGIEYVKEMVEWVKDVDEDHPVSMGENKYKVNWSNPAIIKQVDDELDIVGLNYGEAYYDSLHVQNPDWKIFASETTMTVSSRGYYASPWISGNHAVDNVNGNLADDAVSGKHASEYDNRTSRYGRNVTEALIFDRDRQFIAGQFVWTGFDYIGEPEPFYGTAKSSYCGIVDTCGFAKDRYYLYQSQWTDVKDNPMVHIMPHWNWEDDAMRKKVTYPDKTKLEYLDEAEMVNYSDDAVGKIPVRIYSNAPAVELFVDGVSQGKKNFAQMTTDYGKEYRQQSENSDRLYLEWALPWEYKIGTKIEAVAYDESGTEIARDEVVTAGQPASLSASADRETITCNGTDLSYITVDVLDKDGNFMPVASNQIEFNIEGDGEIVGVDNGNPVSKERYKDTNGKWLRQAFNGKALVIVKSLNNEGSFTVTASSDGLAPASVTVQTVPEKANISDDIADRKDTGEKPEDSVGSDENKNQSVVSINGNSDKDTVIKKKEVKSFKKGKYIYKVTDSLKKTVSVSGCTKKNVKSVNIPAVVKNGGIKYKVTSIGKKAFYKYSKLIKVTIGKNVISIKTAAFKNCNKLKVIVFKTKKLKSVSKQAFAKTSKNYRITGPAGKRKQYDRMLKNAGLR